MVGPGDHLLHESLAGTGNSWGWQPGKANFPMFRKGVWCGTVVAKQKEEKKGGV